MSSSLGTQHVLDKLKTSVEHGNYYEAHQMYRSVFRRLVKQGKYQEARGLVQAGAFDFFRANQDGSAVDLALLLLDVFCLAQEPVAVESCAVLLELLSLIPVKNSSRADFITGSIKWSVKCGQFPLGEPALHLEIGRIYLRDKQFKEALNHLLLASSPECAAPLAQLALEPAFDEFGQSGSSKLLFNVLKLLTFSRVETAWACFQAYLVLAGPGHLESVAYHGIEMFVYKDSVLNFVQYLLLACKSGDAKMFMFLKQRYEVLISETLGQDGMTLFSSVGQKMFGIQNQQAGLNLNALLGSLFGGGGAPQQSKGAAAQISADVD